MLNFPFRCHLKPLFLLSCIDYALDRTMPFFFKKHLVILQLENLVFQKKKFQKQTQTFELQKLTLVE